MILNMDNIEFESRYEISEVIAGLEIWLKEHKNHDSYDKMKELKLKLETMWLNF